MYHTSLAPKLSAAAGLVMGGKRAASAGLMAKRIRELRARLEAVV